MQLMTQSFSIFFFQLSTLNPIPLFSYNPSIYWITDQKTKHNFTFQTDGTEQVRDVLKNLNPTKSVDVKDISAKFSSPSTAVDNSSYEPLYNF